MCLAQVCASYNRGNGDFGQCDDKDNCNRLHICEDYIRGTCDSGDCGRSHDFFEPHPMKTLRGRGVPGGMVGSMLSVYQRILVLRGTLAKDAKPEAGARTRGRRGKGRSKGDAAAINNTAVTKDESRPAKPGNWFHLILACFHTIAKLHLHVVTVRRCLCVYSITGKGQFCSQQYECGWCVLCK